MERNYFEKTHRNEITSKRHGNRLSFLKYRKLINKGQSDQNFFSFKNTSKEARWIENVN